jgi:hypothetical protein
MFAACAQSQRSPHIKKQLTSFNTEQRKVSPARSFAESDIPKSYIQIEPLSPENIPARQRRFSLYREATRGNARAELLAPVKRVVAELELMRTSSVIFKEVFAYDFPQHTIRKTC